MICGSNYYTILNRKHFWRHGHCNLTTHCTIIFLLASIFRKRIHNHNIVNPRIPRALRYRNSAQIWFVRDIYRCTAGPCTWLSSSSWWPTICGCSARDCTYTWLWWWCSSMTWMRCAGSTPSAGAYQPCSPLCTCRGGTIRRTPRSECTDWNKVLR